MAILFLVQGMFRKSFLATGILSFNQFLFLLLIADQLERVFLRLGHAETDEQLQNIISKFLPPVLLKLSSTQEGVRKKVRVQFTIKIHWSDQEEGNARDVS